MIHGVAFCPHPPVLLPDIAGSSVSDLAPLRAACAEALEAISALNKPLVLMGTDEVSVAHSPLCRGSMSGFGLDLEVHLGSPGCGGELDLPLSLTVGAWLVHTVLGGRTGARAFSVGPDFASSRAATELLGLVEEQDVVVLALGDGSARRSVRAPGYLDERAQAFDQGVVQTLAAGRRQALEEIDLGLGAQLLAAGPPVWNALARVLDREEYVARLRYSDDPYGVGYFVADWIRGA